MYVPPQWRGHAKLIFAFREAHEPELRLLEQILAPGHDVVDVGANLGTYTLLSARLVGEAGRVLAFEPARDAFQALHRSVALNQFSNVALFQSAAGDVEGVRRLHHFLDPSRNSLSAGPGRVIRAEDVIVTTVDMALQRQGVARVNFLKLDVEGAEELVLRGATNVLDHARPTILFEVNPEAARALGLSPRGAWELLARLNYEFWTYRASQNLSRLQACPDGGNVWAFQRGTR